MSITTKSWASIDDNGHCNGDALVSVKSPGAYYGRDDREEVSFSVYGSSGKHCTIYVTQHGHEFVEAAQTREVAPAGGGESSVKYVANSKYITVSIGGNDASKMTITGITVYDSEDNEQSYQASQSPIEIAGDPGRYDYYTVVVGYSIGSNDGKITAVMTLSGTSSMNGTPKTATTDIIQYND